MWQTSSPILVPSYLREFDDAKHKFGADRNHQKTEVINYIADLDAAPLESGIDEVKLHATVSTVAAGSTTLGVAVGAPAVHGRPALSQRRRCSSNGRTCSAVPGSSDRLLHSFVKALASAASSTSSGCMTTQSCKQNGLLKSTMRLEKVPLKDSSRDSRKTGRSKRHTAQANPGLDTRELGTHWVQHNLAQSLQPNRASLL